MESGVMLIAGVGGWMTAIFAEAFMGSKKLIPPCQTEVKFTGYNFLFVGFPVALILVAEMRLMQAMGALGLTCILESFCLLGLTGYEQVQGAHLPFCIVACASHFLVCLNVACWSGLFVGVPLLFLSLLLPFLHFTCNQMYLESLVIWAFDIWLVLSRIVLVLVEPSSDWVDHHWFDIVGSSSLLLLLVFLCILARSTVNMPRDSWVRGLFYPP